MTTDTDLPEEPPVSDAELRELLARAKATDDDALRRLVSGYVTLRALSADVIEFVETQYSGSTIARVPLLNRVKRLTRRTAT